MWMCICAFSMTKILTGNAPGKAASNGATFVFGVAANATGAGEKALDAELICA